MPLPWSHTLVQFTLQTVFMNFIVVDIKLSPTSKCSAVGLSVRPKDVLVALVFYFLLESGYGGSQLLSFFTPLLSSGLCLLQLMAKASELCSPPSFFWQRLPSWPAPTAGTTWISGRERSRDRLVTSLIIQPTRQTLSVLTTWQSHYMYFQTSYIKNLQHRIPYITMYVNKLLCFVTQNI